MTSDEMARAHLRRAATVLREAERLYEDEAWNLVVRRSQEAVELALKGVLRSVGAEVPKVHDVSGAHTDDHDWSEKQARVGSEACLHLHRPSLGIP
jgi:hypothetical protein